MGVLGFPQRYVLLARSWGFPPGGNDFVLALLGDDYSEKKFKQLGSKITKWGKGANSSVEAKETSKYVENLLKPLQTYFTRFDATPEAFRHAMLSDDDTDFIRFLNRGIAPLSLQDPIGPLLRGIQGQLLGNCLLYRLGAFDTKVGIANFLRVVPANISTPAVSQASTNYLHYTEYYRCEGQLPSPSVAKGTLVVPTPKTISIVGDDSEVPGQRDMFLIQLDYDPVLVGSGSKKLSAFKGVITMNGDLGYPTSYVVYLRKIDKAASVSWDEFRTKFEQTIALRDSDGDLKFETDEVEEHSGVNYSDFVTGLQIPYNNMAVRECR